MVVFSHKLYHSIPPREGGLRKYKIEINICNIDIYQEPNGRNTAAYICLCDYDFIETRNEISIRFLHYSVAKGIETDNL